MSGAGRGSIAALAVVVAACEGGGGAAADGGDGDLGCPTERLAELEVPVEVGTGEDAFVPIEDGAEVPLTYGFQGGWHIWVSTRGEGIESGRRGCLDIDIETTDGEPISVARPVTPVLDPRAGGGFEVLGWPALVPAAACFVGSDATVRVFVSDEEGRWGEDARRFVVGGGTNPPTGACPD